MVKNYMEERAEIRARVLAALEADPRVIGCLDYGSTGHGRGDQWSDLDLALFIRDEDLASFESGWRDWATQFGDLLLAYTSFVGHPWAVYSTGKAPLRVDFSFHACSYIANLMDLPLAPTDARQMVLYDETGGALFSAVSKLVGKSLEPDNLEATFQQTCGDFWTMLLRCHTRLLRGQFWSVRNDHHVIVLNNLMALLRLKNGATGNWLASNSADGLETILGQEELARLKMCVPGRDDRDLPPALRETAEFGADTCSQIHAAKGWLWPERLAERTLVLLRPGIVEINGLPPVSMKPIGVVHNSVEELLPPNEIKAVPSRIIVDPALSAGLDGLTKSQRLLVIFQFHKLANAGYELHQHPKNNPHLPKKGVFALHSPIRPNPIGVTEVDLLHREENILHVRGLDAVNGTPVLDLKLN